MYEIKNIIHTSQIPSYSRYIHPLRQSGLSVLPNFQNGTFLIKNPNGEEIFFMSTRYFNRIMHEISHYVQKGEGIKSNFGNIIRKLQSGLELYPNQSNLSIEEFTAKLKKEFLFISTNSMNLYIPLFEDVKNKYVKKGILHFLVYHYSSFKRLFAEHKEKTLFNEPVTINELFGFLVLMIDSDKTSYKSEGDRQILENSIGQEKYRMVLEPFECKLMKLVSFYQLANS